MIITRSDIFLHILFTSIHVSVCVCLLIRWSISTFVYLCDCGKFPLPSPSVAFVRKHGDWQSAFSMIYTFAQVESSVWISFNKLLNSRLAKSILIPDAILMRPKKIDSGKIVQQANQLRDFMLDWNQGRSKHLTVAILQILKKNRWHF